MRQIVEYVAARNDWSFDVVVHVGAGTGTELAAYARMGARRTVLVEPNPELAAMLRRRAESLSGVQVHEVAVAARSGDATLEVFNNARESSLYAPTGLSLHFPNLRPVASVPVRTTSLQDVLAAAAGDSSSGHLLVLDVAALEPAALEGCALDILHDWSHVALRTAALPLHADCMDEAGLRGWLERAGYRQVFEAPDAVAPFRELLFARDDAAVDAMRLARAAAELASLRAESAEQAQRYAGLRAESELHIALAHQAQAELERRARLEHERAQRLRALAASMLARAGVAAADAPAAPDIEAFLAGCVERMQEAWTRQEAGLADERDAAQAARRALAEQEAARAADGERLRTLQAELERVEAARAALAAEAAQAAARAQQLGSEMTRAQAQIGLIRDLLLRETDR